MVYLVKSRIFTRAKVTISDMKLLKEIINIRRNWSNKFLL